MKKEFTIVKVRFRPFVDFVASIFALEVNDSKNNTLYLRGDDCITNLIEKYDIKIVNEEYDFIHLIGRKCQIVFTDDLIIRNFSFVS